MTYPKHACCKTCTLNPAQSNQLSNNSNYNRINSTNNSNQLSNNSKYNSNNSTNIHTSFSNVAGRKDGRALTVRSALLDTS